MLPSNDDAYVRCLAALNDHPIAFVGAGISAQQGYPSWAELLRELESRAQQRNPIPPKRAAAQSDDVLWEAEVYRRRMGPDSYRGILTELFAPRGGDLHETIKALACLPFRHFITTNYDNLLDRAESEVHKRPLVSIEWRARDALRDFITELTRPIGGLRKVVHLHGRHPAVESIVLTESDYVERYAVPGDTSVKLYAIFATQRVVFIGFSLTDPDFGAVLRQIQASLGPGNLRHFAILGLEDWADEPAIRARLVGKFGVEPVFYPVIRRTRAAPENAGEVVSYRDHEGLGILLRRLHEGRQPADSALPGGTRTRDPADPQKGRFGGLAQRDGFVLEATVTDAADRADWFGVTLTVRGIETAVAQTAPVVFHLHDSFRVPVRTVAPGPDGRAQLRLLAYGAFTVGAEIGPTRLELDLATLSSAPQGFRLR